MSFAVCCSDLEKLIAKPDKERGLGLLWVINKRDTRFILEYRRDWKDPLPDEAIQITFCPYCGRKLQLVKGNEGPAGKIQGREEQEDKG